MKIVSLHPLRLSKIFQCNEKIPFILVFLTVMMPAPAQQHEIDSITALLPQLRDSIRLRAIGNLTELSIGLPSP